MVDLDAYLKFEKEKVIFIGEKLTIWIPMSFTKYKMIKIADTVETLAVFAFNLNDEPTDHGMFLPAVLEMAPSSVKEKVINGKEYLVCEFKKNDVFITKKYIVENSYIAYIIFTEFIENGNIPPFIKYEDCAFLFDIVKEVTGSKIPADHAVFEIIFSHLFRTAKNIFQPYRLSDMTQDPIFLKLKDVAHATQSTTSKLVSGYLNDALVSSAVNENKEHSKIEDLLRQ